MSRSTTSTAPQTGKTPQSSSTAQPAGKETCMATDKVATRAYQKWLQGGCVHGRDQQHWLEAEAELKAEMSRTGGTTSRR